MLKKQKFGVEIEMTGIGRGQATDIIASVLNSGDVCGPRNDSYYTMTIKDSHGREWKVMRDSSITPQPSNDEYRVEFVTPPLEYKDIELLQNIIRRLRENGAKANSSCGIHIHIDGANHTADSLKRMINFMVARQDLVYDALRIQSRGNRWCKRLSPELLNSMKREKNLTRNKVEEIWYSPANDGYCSGIDHHHYNSTRYHGINLHSFFSKGTIEFRLFNSTLHAGKIKAYIQFCLAVSSWALTSTGKVIFRSIDSYTPEQKVTIMRNVLTHRLGLSGDEFKTCRYHLMKPLKDAAGLISRAA